MADTAETLREEIATLRAELAALRAELAELRAYIGEVPCMECGITPFDEWKQARDAPG